MVAFYVNNSLDLANENSFLKDNQWYKLEQVSFINQ